MNGDTFHKNKAQQRAIHVLLTLAGHEIEGVPQSVIATAVGAPASRVHHDLRNLREAGIAERLENGNWCLSPKLIQIALAHQTGLSRAQQRLRDVQQRYSRDPH